MRKQGIDELLINVKETLNIIDQEHEKANTDLSVKEFLKIQIKHVLEDMRSCLDYIANDIYDELFVKSTASKKVDIHFPYGKDENAFKAMAGRYFKNLKEKNEEIYNIIIAVQPFKCGSMWLYNLCKMTNINKHEGLVGQKRETQAEIDVSGISIVKVENISENTNITFSGCTFNGIKQKDDIYIANGKINVGNNDNIDTQIKTEFYFEGTDINCIELVKNSYLEIVNLVESVYGILNR